VTLTATLTSRPTLGRIVRHAGVAGQLAYSVSVAYQLPDGTMERASVVTFTGSVYGTPGPVVMVTPGIPRGTFVTDPGRFGETFGPEWVRAFFA
jgi:hypothetical protein